MTSTADSTITLPPPNCTADGFTAAEAATGFRAWNSSLTGWAFEYRRSWYHPTFREAQWCQAPKILPISGFLNMLQFPQP